MAGQAPSFFLRLRGMQMVPGPSGCYAGTYKPGRVLRALPSVGMSELRIRLDAHLKQGDDTERLSANFA